MSNRRIKVLFIRPTMGMGGADRVTLNLLNSFDRDIFDCELLLNKKTGVFLDAVPDDVVVHEANAMNVLTMFRAIKSIAIKQKYDYLFSTSGGTNVPLLIASALLRNKPKVVISERVNLVRPDKNGAKQKFLRNLKRLSYKRADIVTAVSKELTDDIHSYFSVPREKLKVVNNPIINYDFLAQKTEELSDERFDRSKPSVLTAVRLINTKNVQLLLNAFAAIKDRTDAMLYVLGHGPLENQLKSQASDLGIGDRVLFLGFDPNPFKWMNIADIFVLPSNNEGMPGVLIQAMGCGCACIATDSKTGPNELIEDGINGFLVPVNGQKLLSERMLDLLENKELREKIKSTAPLGLSRFEESKAVESYFQLLT